MFDSNNHRSLSRVDYKHGRRIFKKCAKEIAVCILFLSCLIKLQLFFLLGLHLKSRTVFCYPKIVMDVPVFEQLIHYDFCLRPSFRIVFQINTQISFTL